MVAHMTVYTVFIAKFLLLSILPKFIEDSKNFQNHAS